MKLERTREKRPIKIIQFGEGNFLRGFIDYFIQELNDKKLFDGDVVVVQPLNVGRVEELKSQDGLYTLYLEGLLDNKPYKKHQVIDCLSDFINPYIELDKYLAYAQSTDLEYVVSNTTEAGIVYVPEKLKKTETPQSYPGKLLLFLYERYHHFKDKENIGLEIYSLELIDNNGDALKSVLEKLARYNNYDSEFINWLLSKNIFYNTLVDRIVSGFPKNIDEVTRELGYNDTNIVKGEVFHLWIIDKKENYTSKLENAFKKSNLNVHYVKDISPYKEQKVKILNGSHTAMVPISYMLGYKIVREAMKDPLVSRYLDELVFGEVINTINLKKEDVTLFANSVFERFKNPYIDHQLLSIALNSVSKYKSRILPSVVESFKKGIFPKCGLFALAALIYFYLGIDEEGKEIPLNDDKEILVFFKDVSKLDDKEIVSRTLKLPLLENKVFTKEVEDYIYKWFKIMNEKGMKKALEAFYE